jgi:hypothetical protein
MHEGAIMRGSRGQTIIEFVVAMPIVLFALFAIIYFAQYGVVSERTELALRYGGIAAFNTGTGEYSAADIYSNLSGNTPGSCPTPPSAILYGGGPFPGATSPPFWQPNALPTPPTCSTQPYGFGGSQFIASHFWTESKVNLQAIVNVPAFLQAALGASTAQTDSTLTFIHAATPAIIIYCSQEVQSRVQASLDNEGGASLPTPIPDGSTPEPAQSGNTGCN